MTPWKGMERWQFVPLAGVISVVLLLVAGGLVAFLNQDSYRAQKLNEVQVQARVVSESLAGALAFEDANAAREYLGALKANPEVEAAGAYGDDGRLTASYSRSPEITPPPLSPALGTESHGSVIEVTTPVRQGSTQLGTVYLRTDAETFMRRVWRYAGVALLAVLASLVIGLLAAAHAAVRRANATLSHKADDLHSVATRQQAIFDAAFDAIVTLNPSGGIESINRAGERMFGYPAGHLTHRDIGLLVDFGGEGNFLERVGGSAGSLAGGMLRELSGRRQDGSTFPVDLALSAMQLPSGTHVVAVIRDITDRKRTEQLKVEFVSTVSHELRTPLTSIAGSLGLLTGGAGGELPEKAGRLIAIAHSNCQRLVRLINDILDIEKLESGALRFDFAPVRVEELVTRSIEGLRGYADSLGVRTQVSGEDSDLIVRGDADRLIQVLTNLLSNALKFSPTGDVVELELSRQGHAARLTVRDHGAGIPEAFRARVFSKFAQADSTDSRQKGGTGLGLAISKEIVDRHGGRLWFESTIGEGTSFHVELPLMEAAARPAPLSADAGERLLICEDDPDTALILRDTMEQDGFAVDVVGTLEAAAAAAAVPGRYAAILLDLQLPDGDGVTLIKQLRESEVTRDLPIIVVSAYIDRARDAARAHCLNVVDWMEKPVDLRRLQRAVKAALDRAPRPDRLPVILHVDDDHDILQVTATALADLGQIVSVDCLRAARAILDEREPDLVILDVGLPDGSGLELLPDLEDRYERNIPVVVFSAQETDASYLSRVDEVLVKSRSSMASLAQTVKRLVRRADIQDSETQG